MGADIPHYITAVTFGNSSIFNFTSPFYLITGPPTHSVGGSIVLLTGVCRHL